SHLLAHACVLSSLVLLIRLPRRGRLIPTRFSAVFNHSFAPFFVMEDKPSTSNGTTRNCLICGMKTTSCHLGVDACRACTVFYRRAKKSKPYACRSNTRKCVVTAESGVSCKRCRFDRFERILRESGAKELLDSQSEREPSPIVAQAPMQAAPASVPNPFADRTPSADRLLQTPSTSSAFSPVSPSRRERTIIEKCKMFYKVQCSMRRMCELAGRTVGPHPLEMTEAEFPFYPATFSALNAATKIALASILEFATNMFPEFALISKEERWHLAVTFFYRFHAFESCYRAEKYFPQYLDRAFGSYTCFFTHENVDNFFDDLPVKPEEANMTEAKKFMLDILERLATPGRSAVRRAAPDNDEFHAVLVILFWFTEGMELREEIVRVADGYRAAVLQELHSYYREELGLSDYANRVGELFMLILHFERNKDIKEHFEIIRLLGIFTDDTFMYQLQKDCD
ncbi:hypothetical protein PFISCL1PPCAC_13916, partial [Pristionchus fissidentatus]